MIFLSEKSGLAKVFLIIFSIIMLFVIGCTDRPRVTDNDIDNPDNDPVNAPGVTINAPIDEALYAPGDTIEFTATITDSDNDINALSVEWTSSIDGVINSSPAIDSGQASFSTTALAWGVHSIVLRVTDPDNNRAVDSIEVRNTLPTLITLIESLKYQRPLH